MLAAESVVAEEYAFDVAAGAEASDATVTLDLRSAAGAPATVYATCGADGTSLVGVGHLSAAGVVGAGGQVHVVALSVPALPAKR